MRAEVGAWSPTANWPIGAIHAIVTPDGNILTYGATDRETSDLGVGGFGVAYDVWDPDEGLGDEAHATPREPNHDQHFLQRSNYYA